MGVQPLAPPGLQMDPSAACCLRVLAVDNAALPVLEGVHIHRWHTSPPQPLAGHTCHRMGDIFLLQIPEDDLCRSLALSLALPNKDEPHSQSIIWDKGQRGPSRRACKVATGVRRAALKDCT